MRSINSIDNFLRLPPFAIDENRKSKLFSAMMWKAYTFHYKNCPEFQLFCQKQHVTPDKPAPALLQYPYLPVNIFKKHKLISVPENKIKNLLSSSATSGNVSTIYIDSLTAKRQMLASSRITAAYLGNNRRPFLILDENPLLSRSKNISARSAATRGILMFSDSEDYFIKNTTKGLVLDKNKLLRQLKVYENSQEEICIFGFTYILYNYAIKFLKEKNITFNLSDKTKVVHIGGWKKLESEQISRKSFLNNIEMTLGIPKNNVLDFYGFTEQMGLVYINSGDSPKTVPLYAEIIIRDFQTLESVEEGKAGLIQILTPLPYSYPGISVLTDDVGRIIGEGKDREGRWGTKFEIIGRAKKSEARGCGDIMSESMLRES